MVKNLSKCGRPGFDAWVRKISWIRKWQPTVVFLPGKSHGQRSLAATAHRFARVSHDLAAKPPPPHDEIENGMNIMMN